VVLGGGVHHQHFGRKTAQQIQLPAPLSQTEPVKCETPPVMEDVEHTRDTLSVRLSDKYEGRFYNVVHSDLVELQEEELRRRRCSW
jgi:hypothetical protein